MTNTNRAAVNHLYEVAYRDGRKVMVATTLATSEADAMDQFLEPLRATRISEGA